MTNLMGERYNCYKGPKLTEKKSAIGKLFAYKNDQGKWLRWVILFIL